MHIVLSLAGLVSLQPPHPGVLCTLDLGSVTVMATCCLVFPFLQKRLEEEIAEAKMKLQQLEH